MGDVWIPDRALTLDEMKAALEIPEEEYVKLSPGRRRLEVVLTGAMLVAGCTAGLRGEEILHIDLGMM